MLQSWAWPHMSLLHRPWLHSLGTSSGRWGGPHWPNGTRTGCWGSRTSYGGRPKWLRWVSWWCCRCCWGSLSPGLWNRPDKESWVSGLVSGSQAWNWTKYFSRRTWQCFLASSQVRFTVCRKSSCSAMLQVSIRAEEEHKYRRNRSADTHLKTNIWTRRAELTCMKSSASF